MHAQQVGAPAPAADLSEALATLSLVNQAANQQTTVVNDALLQAIERLTAASQRNFQAMTEEMGKLSELVAQLKQQLKDQAQIHQAKEQASDARTAVLEKRVDDQARELIRVKTEHEATKKRLEEHTHPYVNSVSNQYGTPFHNSANTSPPNPPPEPPPKTETKGRKWWKML